MNKVLRQYNMRFVMVVFDDIGALKGGVRGVIGVLAARQYEEVLLYTT